MPIYEYQCSKCQARTEEMQRFSDPPLTTCKACGGELKKLISNTSFVLKGDGWYVTDYPSDERKKAGESNKSPSSESQKKPDKKAVDSTPEAKPSTEKKESTSREKPAPKNSGTEAA